jgi:hypothetical protein
LHAAKSLSPAVDATRTGVGNNDVAGEKRADYVARRVANPVKEFWLQALARVAFQISFRRPRMTNTPVLGGAPPGTVPVTGSEPRSLDAAAAELARHGPLVEEPPDPVELVRIRLEIDRDVPDVTIAASLAQILVRTGQRERWLAAFGSPLGKYLARRGGDLNVTLGVLLALVPKPPS